MAAQQIKALIDDELVIEDPLIFFLILHFMKNFCFF